MRATWKIERAGDVAVLTVTPYAKLPRTDTRAVSEEASQLLDFVAADAADRNVVVAPPD